MNGCDNCSKRRDIQKECPWGGTYHYRGEHGEKIGICNAYQQESNADHIRSMTDKELAELIMLSDEFDFDICRLCDYQNPTLNDDRGLCLHDMGICLANARCEAFKKWLKQPYKEG